MTIWHHKRTLRPGGQSCHNEGLQDVESWGFALPYEAQPNQGLAKLEYSGGEILTRWFLICCRCKGWWSTWLPMKSPPCQGLAIFLKQNLEAQSNRMKYDEKIHNSWRDGDQERGRRRPSWSNHWTTLQAVQRLLPGCQKSYSGSHLFICAVFLHQPTSMMHLNTILCSMRSTYNNTKPQVIVIIGK